jgi:phenylacetate-CoA ligase
MTFFDDQDTIEPGTREAALMTALPRFLASTIMALPAWSELLGGIDPQTINSREMLARLPVLRKDVLMDMQSALPPFGGLVDTARLNGTRVFVSPGPVLEPQAPGADPWGGARAMRAAGFRAGDIVWNCLSYHMTPGGFMFDEAARALGCIVFPGGIGNTEQQVATASALRPRAFCGTPDVLKIMLDKAAESGRDLTSIKHALVSGGALFPSLRAEYAKRGVAVMQAFATADLGVIAYETAAADGSPLPGMLVNEGLILEIVRPGTGDPVPDGEVGEIVVTNFNATYPLIRFATGDMSKIMPGPSPCGRTAPRIAGWLGRADQRTKIKGMFVDPKQIAEIVRRAAETGNPVERARLTVSREGERDRMELAVAGVGGCDLDTQMLAGILADVTKLAGTVSQVDAATLPNDGKVIADERDYQV